MQKLDCNYNASEIYMTTKLTVTSWKWGKDCVKERCKRKMEKEKGFLISFPVFGWTMEVENEASYFLTSLCIQTIPTRTLYNY